MENKEHDSSKKEHSDYSNATQLPEAFDEIKRDNPDSYSDEDLNRNVADDADLNAESESEKNNA